MKLSFGIKTAPQSTTYEDMKRVWLEADTIPSIPNDMEGTRELVRSFIEAGATHLVMNLRPPYPANIVHRVDEEIIQPLKAQFERD